VRNCGKNEDENGENREKYEKNKNLVPKFATKKEVLKNFAY
jgi:hypothetical protein